MLSDFFASGYIAQRIVLLPKEEVELDVVIVVADRLDKVFVAEVSLGNDILFDFFVLDLVSWGISGVLFVHLNGAVFL